MNEYKKPRIGWINVALLLGFLIAPTVRYLKGKAIALNAGIEIASWILGACVIWFVLPYWLYRFRPRLVVARITVVLFVVLWAVWLVYWAS